MPTQETPQGVTPHLVVDNAAAALEFYKKAFGATETMRLPAEDGKRLMHSEMMVNGSRFFVRDHFPEYCTAEGGKVRQEPPKALGGTSFTMHLEVPNCDKAVKRAVDAGATVTMVPEDTFWGDRYGAVVDPFGHAWSFANRLPGQPG
ncbi:MAG: VOC family protein [Dongiaceae bacterium]